MQAAVLYPFAATVSMFANMMSRPVSSSNGENQTRFQMTQAAHVVAQGGSLEEQQGRSNDDEDMNLQQRFHMACHWTLSGFQCFSEFFRHSKLVKEFNTVLLTHDFCLTESCEQNF